LRRFFSSEWEGDKAVLIGAEAAHAVRVLRLKEGEKILVSQGLREAVCTVVYATTDRVEAQAEEIRECPANPKRTLALFQAYMKSDKMEWIAQKGTELGLTAFVPFVSRYCVKVPEGASADKSLGRLQRISQEAMKQCGRTLPVEVSPILSFGQMKEALMAYDTVIFAYENAKTPLKDALPLEGKVALIVGSEGGFSAEEAEELEKLGVRTVSLGSRILRGETAAISLVALAAYEMGC